MRSSRDRLSATHCFRCSNGAGAWLVDRNPLSVFEAFDRRDVVYLSPDAHDALDEVLPDKVYVIGGIIDRNLKRGLTLSVAEGNRAQVARLPFDEYLPEVPPRGRVLTVFACVRVLVARFAGKGWKEVLETGVPPRGMSQTSRRARREARQAGNESARGGLGGEAAALGEGESLDQEDS